MDIDKDKEPTNIPDILGISWKYDKGEHVPGDADVTSGIVKREDSSWMDRNVEKIVIGMVAAAAAFTLGRMCVYSDTPVIKDDTSDSSPQ